MDTGGEVVEVNEVLHDVLVVAHAEILEFSFRLAFGIVRSEVVLQLRNEFIIVVEPCRLFTGG